MDIINDFQIKNYTGKYKIKNAITKIDITSNEDLHKNNIDDLIIISENIPDYNNPQNFYINENLNADKPIYLELLNIDTMDIIQILNFCNKYGLLHSYNFTNASILEESKFNIYYLTNKYAYNKFFEYDFMPLKEFYYYTTLLKILTTLNSLTIKKSFEKEDVERIGNIIFSLMRIYGEKYYLIKSYFYNYKIFHNNLFSQISLFLAELETKYTTYRSTLKNSKDSKDSKDEDSKYLVIEPKNLPANAFRNFSKLKSKINTKEYQKYAKLFNFLYTMRYSKKIIKEILNINSKKFPPSYYTPYDYLTQNLKVKKNLF